jgi:hypothetical protein
MNQQVVLRTMVLFASVQLVVADPIAIFNINSNPPDTSSSTGTNVASLGAGTIQGIGGVTVGYVTGGGADPATSDDTAFSTKDYPVQGEFNNKTAGIQVNVSTVGFSNIVVRWDQGASGTASKYYRLQYSFDGNYFIDVDPVIVINSSSGFAAFTNSFSPTSGVNNNGAFAIRILSEWESTAIGTAFNEYMPVTGTSSYAPSGSAKFDYIVVSGTPIFDGNYAPTISSIADQTVRVTRASAAIPFTVLDAETAASNLVVSAASSNPTAVPVQNIVFGGASQNRTVTITGGAQPGASTIAISVRDAGNKTTSTSFVVTVLPLNTAPVITAITPTNTLPGTTVGPIPFTVGDAESPASSLTLSASTSNSVLVAVTNIVFGGSGSNRTATVTPNPGQFGVAPITVTVSDGTNTAASSFAVMVSPQSSIVLYEPFDYGSGSVISNSGGLWANRSGTNGDCLVTNNQLQVSAKRSEDIIATLAGAPYAKNFTNVLYSSFKVRFLDLPNQTPDYFAHFGTASGIRARVYAFIPVGANFGDFHLAIGNATNSMEWPNNLNTNVTYTLVTRYNVDNASSTLWVNPSAENDPSVTAADSATGVSISDYGFRQSSTFDSTIYVDDLRVGLSFAAVTGPLVIAPAPPGGIPLNALRSGSTLWLTWTNSTFTLQAASTVNGTYTNVPSAMSPYSTTLSGSSRFFRLKAN